VNPDAQYADDRNLRARQRLWGYKAGPFDLFTWVLDLAEVRAGQRVLDVGCGNGAYLRALRGRAAEAVGCDLSLGMLRSTGHPTLINADAARLPFGDAAFDIVLAPHMLYHVPDRAAAVGELRRVLRTDGVAVVVTNGAEHMRSLWQLVETAVRRTDPHWEVGNPLIHLFSLENGATQLGAAFASVTCVRPIGAPAVEIDDADVVADYVASVADHYQDEISRPWSEVVGEVRHAAQAVIDTEGVFTVTADTGAFVCR
jgi:SAM-dependent methyltransferase